jgi:hypothetical protein
MKIEKECPFNRNICTDGCALYLGHGCSILHIAFNLQNIDESLEELKK